jgi:hypothetical protein
MNTGIEISGKESEDSVSTRSLDSSSSTDIASEYIDSSTDLADE